MAYPRTHNLFGSTFGGLIMRQYWSDLALWELFLNEYEDIRTVVELGSFHGGMTEFLKTQTLSRGQNFFTLDKDRPQVLDTEFAKITNLEKDFILGDFWTDTLEHFVSILHNPVFKPLLLFVDGGNKAKEFVYFVPELSDTDYCAVHDYGTEFKPSDSQPVDHLIERIFEDECTGPPQPCLTRFWKKL